MPDDRYVDVPPAGADGWREVWQADRRYRDRPSRYELILGFLRRLFRRATEADAERQKNFNVALLDLMRDVRAEVIAARQDLRGDLEDVQRKAGEALGVEAAKLHDLILVASKRNDALIAALDQKIETLAVRIRDVVNPAVTPDTVYRRLEDALRGGEAEVRAEVAHYVRLAADHQPVLDVGCGRGEFLAACREASVSARGVDTNERSVADLKARGFDVALAGVPECFGSIGDASLGSILAMHVVEHLPVEALFALFREAARVLKPGGLLMIETPNAESIAVSASDFWRDPTHLAPRHVAALTVLAREHGFEIAEARAIHELPEGLRIPAHPGDSTELRRVISAINDRFFAPADLRLVLRR
jgi:O-antigen chain-terminating methyltransferase